MTAKQNTGIYAPDGSLYITLTNGAGSLVSLTALGVETATSLALGGATIGTNALAVTGTSNLAGNVTVTGQVVLSGGLFFGAGSTSILNSSTDGIVLMTNAAGTAFTRLQFGGTTSSFPSIKRNAAGIDFRLADDSTYTTITSSNSFSTQQVVAGSTTAIPAGGNNAIGFVATTTGNFGIFFGSSTPTLSAAQGSLYLRSDGSSTTTRMYVNTNGSTTWTAVSTVA